MRYDLCNTGRNQKVMAMVDLMSLYRLAGGHFVQDGHHRVGWIDAEVTEFRSSKSLSAV